VSNSADRNKQTFLTSYEMRTGKDLEALGKLFAPRFVVHRGATDALVRMLGGEVGPRPETWDFATLLQQMGKTMGGLSDLSHEIEEVYAVDDIVWARRKVAFTHSGLIYGAIPATGRRATYDEVALVKFDDEGRMAEGWFFCDTFDILEQLGLELTVDIGDATLARPPAGRGPIDVRQVPGRLDDHFASTTAEETARNKQTFLESYDARHRKEMPRLDVMFAPEFVVERGSGDSAMLMAGRDPGPRPDAWNLDRFMVEFKVASAGHSDWSHTVDAWAEGNVVVGLYQSDWTHSGEDRGGNPASGSRVSYPYVGRVRFDEQGRMSDGWFLEDPIEVLEQMGAKISIRERGNG